MGLVQKAFSDIITFSRSSNATRVGPTGLVEYAPHNLLQRSQEFDNAYWTKYQSTVTANSLAAPDGTVTADTLTAASTSPCFTYSTAASLAVTTYTLSAYCKAGTANFAVLEISDTIANAGQKYFNLQNGTVGSTSTVGTNVVFQNATIQSVGNGWYRCTATFSITSATNYICSIYITDADNSTNVTNGRNIYLWGAQLSVGPYALDYTPTTSAAVYGPRFDYDGSGVTIVEPVSTNLVLYSQEFDNAAWAGATTAGSVSANATTSPDGTVNADLFIPDTSSSATHRAIQFTSTSSGTFSVSVYAKAAGYSRFFVFAGGANQSALFDLTTQTVVADTRFAAAPSNMTITAIGNGWYRCSFSTNISAAVTNVQITVLNSTANPGDSWTGNGTSGLYIWGAQLEVGSTATAYMVSGATNGFRAVPVVSGSATPKGLLVEEQRTNLLPASNDFSNVTYWTGGGSVTANATTSPDGTVNAAIGASINPASGVGDATVAISGSIFAKANPSGASSLVLRINRFGSGTDYLQVTFNLSTGVAGAVTNSGTASGGSASMVAFGSGWYRCVLSGTVSTTAGTLSFNPQSTCFIYGAQLEAGSFATSLIPTLASTVTRSADVASVNTLSPWFNATEGTLFAEFDFIGLNPASPGVNQGVACFTDGTGASNNLGLLGYGDGSAARYGFVFSGSSLVAFLSGSASSVNTTYKSALATKANDFRLVNSGGSVISDTSGAMPTGMNQLILGNLYTTTNLTYQNGHLRRIAYYPRALTTAELQALTA